MTIDLDELERRWDEGDEWKRTYLARTNFKSLIAELREAREAAEQLLGAWDGGGYSMQVDSEWLDLAFNRLRAALGGEGGK